MSERSSQIAPLRCRITAPTAIRIGRSPDDAEALNLAFAAVPRVEQDDAFYAEYWGLDERDARWWDGEEGWCDPRLLYAPGTRPKTV